MGLNVSKRVSNLRKQVDQSQVGRWRVGRVCLVTFFFLSILSLFILPKTPALRIQSAQDPSTKQLHSHRLDVLVKEFEVKRRWLNDSLLSFVPGSVSSYESLAESVVQSFASTQPTSDVEPSAFEFDNLSRWFSHYCATAMLRLGFIVIAFWPFWLLAALSGYFFVVKRNRGSKKDTILSVLTRGQGPFYSGIHGPLRPNNSMSATDLSCPSLACPPQVSRSQASTHILYKTLRKYNALNETNFELVRTIIAHANFPPFVGEEIPVQQEEQDQNLGALELEEKKSNTGYFEIEPGDLTLENSAIEGLLSVLEAHARIKRYRTMLEKRSFTASVLNKNFPSHEANVAKLFAGAPQQAKMLLQVLSPDRLWVLAGMESAVVATAYLATEAGKSLVYKRHGEGFTRISNYPHLQARAVVQSVAAYHKEYDGDTRLIIRQAIICSRRHGDFGRAFLPNRMPVQSRAMRDWLEIMYTLPDERETIADLVELDAHIEEVSINWKKGFAALVQTSSVEEESRAAKIRRGIPFKSVVFFPIESVVRASLSGIHPKRLERISELLPKTQKYQTHLSISARLPGFKRQAMEAERSGETSDDIIQTIQQSKGGEQLLEQWRIVRRMLTRYNWLSTRVGDDAVPLAGLVLGTLSDGAAEPLPPLVPLRQRRFVELFGRKWEKKLYTDPIDADLLEVHVSQAALKNSAQGEDDDTTNEGEKQSASAGS